MVAPVVGSLILATLGWRASFGALSALTLTFTPTLTLTPTLTPTPTITLTLTLSARFDIPRGGVARSRLRVIAHDVRSFHPAQVGDQVQLNVNVFLRSVIQVLLTLARVRVS